jgi:hypothetical protein
VSPLLSPYPPQPISTMKLTTALAAGILGATTVAAAANMEEMMSLKTASWQKAAAAGAFDGNKR